ncbi:MAG: DUF1573 domain-containing protein [Bacillota bacterium]
MFKGLLFILFSISGLALAQMDPKIEVKPLNYNMGDIKEGNVVTKVYTIKNTGHGILNINNVRVSCGCTAAKPSKNVLKPGESTGLKVSFNSSGRSGKQDKIVYIDSNDPSNNTVQVTFTANVLSKITHQRAPKLSFTERTHDFGKLHEGKIAQYDFNFVNSGSSPLKIGFIVTTGSAVAANISSRKIEPGVKGTLKVVLDTSNRQGRLAVNIKVNSNDPAEPNQTLIVTADIIK